MSFYFKSIIKNIKIYCTSGTDQKIQLDKLSESEKRAKLHEYAALKIKKNKQNKTDILDISEGSMESEINRKYGPAYIEDRIKEHTRSPRNERTKKYIAQWHEKHLVDPQRKDEIEREYLESEVNEYKQIICENKQHNYWIGNKEFYQYFYAETSYVKSLRNVDKLLCSKGQGIEYSKYSAIIKEMVDDENGTLFQYKDDKLLTYITKDINHFVAFLLIFVEILNGDKSKHFTNIKISDIGISGLFKDMKLKDMKRINPFHNVSKSKKHIVDNLHKISEKFVGFSQLTTEFNTLLYSMESGFNQLPNILKKKYDLYGYDLVRYMKLKDDTLYHNFKLDCWEDIDSMVQLKETNENIDYPDARKKRGLVGDCRESGVLCYLFPVLYNLPYSLKDGTKIYIIEDEIKNNMNLALRLILNIYSSIRRIQKLFTCEQENTVNCSNLLSNVTSEIRSNVIRYNKEQDDNIYVPALMALLSNYDNLVFASFDATISQVILRSLDGLQKDIKSLNTLINSIKNSVIKHMKKEKERYEKNIINVVEYTFTRKGAIHNQFNKISEIIGSYKDQYSNWNNQLSKQTHINPKKKLNNISKNPKRYIIVSGVTVAGAVGAILGRNKKINNRSDDNKQDRSIASDSSSSEKSSEIEDVSSQNNDLDNDSSQ